MFYYSVLLKHIIVQEFSASLVRRRDPYGRKEHQLQLISPEANWKVRWYTFHRYTAHSSLIPESLQFIPSKL
jgi:hypothetical protein